MFTFSNFQEDEFKFSPPISKDYKVFVNGEEIPVYTCRISAYPFNSYWPGHQRPLSQTDLVSFVNLVSDEEIQKCVLSALDMALESCVAMKENEDFNNSNQGNVASKANVTARITKAIEMLRFE